MCTCTHAYACSHMCTHAHVHTTCIAKSYHTSTPLPTHFHLSCLAGWYPASFPTYFFSTTRLRLNNQLTSGRDLPTSLLSCHLGDGPMRPGECEVKQSTERPLPCYYYLFSRHSYLIFCCWDKTRTNFGRNKFAVACSLHPPGPADRNWRRGREGMLPTGFLP